jgi:hypothetical protein
LVEQGRSPQRDHAPAGKTSWVLPVNCLKSVVNSSWLLDR